MLNSSHMARGAACIFGQLLLCAVVLACWIPGSTFFAQAVNSKFPSKLQPGSNGRQRLPDPPLGDSSSSSSSSLPPLASLRRAVLFQNPSSAPEVDALSSGAIDDDSPAGTKAGGEPLSGVAAAETELLDTAAGSANVSEQSGGGQNASLAEQALKEEAPDRKEEPPPAEEAPLSPADAKKLDNYRAFFENLWHGSGVDFEDVFESLRQSSGLQLPDLLHRASLEVREHPPPLDQAAAATALEEGSPGSGAADGEAVPRPGGAGAAGGEGEQQDVRPERALHSRTTVRRQATDACWSRRERHLYHQASVHNRSSQALIEEIVRYAEMHRACTEGIKDWEAHFRGESTDPTKASCKYIVPNTPSGLGNHLLSTVAAFTYALLTNRTLLLKHSNIRASLCEPFPASSWRLAWQLEGKVWQQIFGKGVRLGNLTAMAAAGAPLPRMGYMFLEWSYRGPDAVFYCNEGQAVVKDIPWLVLHSDQYYVPGLYFVKDFFPRLEALFPDRQPFTHVARYLLHPGNFLWERITRIHRTYFRHASRRVGIQVRTFKEEDHYANERILDCIVNVSRVLPPPIPSAQLVKLFEKPPAAPGGGPLGPVIANTSPVPVSVFVTSLHRHHYEYIKEAYNEGVASDGSLIALHTESSEEKEQHDLARDHRALTEMWLLSFSDELLTSDVSTFGYFAAGLAGVAPYMMNNIRGKNIFGINSAKSDRGVCDLAPSSEPCFHFPPRGLTCPSGGWKYKEVGVYNKFPFLKSCQDYKQGIRLQ